MQKAKFDPLAITSTLVNRVHRNGITLMTIIEKSRNKSANISPRLIDDLETDYLLANIELENMLKTQLAQKKDKCWKMFLETVRNISSSEKPLFRGVILNIIQTAENILSDKPHPFDHENFELPHYIYPFVSTLQSDNDQKFWEIILKDATTLEESLHDVANNLYEAAVKVSGAVKTMVETPIAIPLTSTEKSFTNEMPISKAINEYMGW